MLTQAPPGVDSIEARVRALRKDRERITGKVYVGIPHRLDRPVSGVLLFTKTTRAARRISQQFEQRRVKKTYWAWVARNDQHAIDEQTCAHADDLPAEGTWRDVVRKVPDEPRAELVEPGTEGGRPASLHYCTLHTTEQKALLEISLITGRMHQIRLQAASRGWPILGDPLYGSTIAFGPAFDNLRDVTIALHARRLEFEHPMTREPIRLTAPLSESWHAITPAGIIAAE
jgi:23S rRNA pseudouridine1911/1915/1917 synthase